jgi:hypothetical protein
MVFPAFSAATVRSTSCSNDSSIFFWFLGLSCGQEIVQKFFQNLSKIYLIDFE